ncbi:MAG: hypothetical protein AAF840_04370 [Bacteroidota bacterium]
MPNLDQDPLDGALEHLKRLPRATPPPELLAQIEADLPGPTAKVVALKEWRKLAAAAVIVLSLNATALIYYANQPAQEASAGYAEAELMADYQLYD